MNPIQIDLIDTIVHDHQEVLRQQASNADVPRDEPQWRQAIGNSLISIGERISGNRLERRPMPTHTLRVS